MKKIILALFVITALASCSNYGKKIEIEGTKGEVFYKGDGVTEDDAKKTGEFLKDEAYFSDKKQASVQVTKDGEAYVLRFVYDKDAFDSMKGAENQFKLLAAKASKTVFNGKKVNVALANKTFKDFKTIAFDEEVARALENPGTLDKGLANSKDDFKHKKIEDVDFFWYGIADEEANMITNYIAENGAFHGGVAELYITQADGRYYIRFPMIASARDDARTLAEVEKVSKQIKDNVFKDTPYSFYVTDEDLNMVKAYDY